MLSTHSVRAVRTPGYLILATMIVLPFIELGVRSWPFRIHSPAWRLGFVGGGAAALVTPLLALYLIFAIAVIADDRLGGYLVACLAGVAATLCLAAAAAFALDVLQMKGHVAASASPQYEVGGAWVISRLIVLALLFVVLAASSFRSARSTLRRSSIAGGKAGGRMLISTTRSPTPTGSAAQRGVDVDG